MLECALGSPLTDKLFVIVVDLYSVSSLGNQYSICLLSLCVAKAYLQLHSLPHLLAVTMFVTYVGTRCKIDPFLLYLIALCALALFMSTFPT